MRRLHTEDEGRRDKLWAVSGGVALWMDPASAEEEFERTSRYLTKFTMVNLVTAFNALSSRQL